MKKESRVALTVKGYPGGSHQNQTATKNNQVPHLDADTNLWAGSVQALSLKGEFWRDSPPNFLITVHGITISLEPRVWNFQVEVPGFTPVRACSVSG